MFHATSARSVREYGKWSEGISASMNEGLFLGQTGAGPRHKKMQKWLKSEKRRRPEIGNHGGSVIFKALSQAVDGSDRVGGGPTAGRLNNWSCLRPVVGSDSEFSV
ncbi:hypothetical protein DESC_300064 [Desulfosarcina cetonica]|nr:hypothetical protein DESC_300064 [Desulfosarcina cetonica]